MNDPGKTFTPEEIERVRLLWYEGKSLAEIGRELNRSKNSVNAKLNRMRDIEGEERWPSRGSPIKPGQKKPPKPKRVPPGASTLPPLG
jgi:IS30 family transposase